MFENRAGKVGRNELCPCGSGKKYKKCCGNLSKINTHASHHFNSSGIEKILKQKEAKEIQRTKQQGLGRPVISAIFKGYRFVAVGSKFYYNKKEKWETFHDFLVEYLKIIFGKKWGASEQNKTLVDRHPVLQWAYLISKYRQSVLDEKDGQIVSSPMTGAVFAYLTLAYNLYLIAHNIHLVHGEGLHARLVARLKDKDTFYPAFYETMVAASFIKAGFQIELENEEDSASSHAEFTATSPKTKRKYSVEAKHRQANKSHTGIGRQIYKALKKDLPYERVVFINLNKRINQTSNGKPEWLNNVIGEMRQLESSELDGKAAPQAYIFVTNHPFLYNLDSFNFPPAAVAEGFKIPDFKLDSAFYNLRDALESREKHIDMFDLMEAMREYDKIPQTFDGEIPEYAFGEIKEPKLKIGNKYFVPNASGHEVAGILEDAVVMENEKKFTDFIGSIMANRYRLLVLYLTKNLVLSNNTLTLSLVYIKSIGTKL